MYHLHHTPLEPLFLIAKRAKFGAPQSGSSMPWDRVHTRGRPASRVSGRRCSGPSPRSPLVGPRVPRAPANTHDHLLHHSRVPTRSPPGAGRPRSLAETRGCCSGTRSRSGAPGRPATQSTEAEPHREAAGAPRGDPARPSGTLLRANPDGGTPRPGAPPAAPAATSPHPLSFLRAAPISGPFPHQEPGGRRK